MVRAAVLVVAFASVAQAQAPTKEFLGDESTWERARVEVFDIAGMGGGTAVRIDGRGRVIVRSVDFDMREKRYETKVAPGEALKLLRDAVAADLLRLQGGKPLGHEDEYPRTVTLVNPLGVRRSVVHYGNDALEALDRMRDALFELARRVAEREKPTFEGAFDHLWEPPGTVQVRVELDQKDGLRHPTWELSPEEAAALRERLKELPAAAEAPRDGPLAFTVLARDAADLHGLWVKGGVVGLGERRLRDARGLEAWLREQAKLRGLKLP